MKRVFAIIALLAVLFTIAGAPRAYASTTYPNTTGLVTSLSLDDGSGTIAQGIAGDGVARYNFTASSATGWTTAGYRAGAYNSSGGKYLSRPGSSPLFLDGSHFAAGGWFFITDNSTNQGLWSPASDLHFGGAGTIKINGGSRGAVFDTWVSSGDNLGLAIGAQNQWHFIAVSYNGSTKLIFVDGRTNTDSLSGSLSQNVGQSTIGEGYDGTGLYTGVTDEFFIYNRSMAVAEMQQLYTIGITSMNISVNDTRTNMSIAKFSYNYTSTNASDPNQNVNLYCAGTSCLVTNTPGTINVSVYNISNNTYFPATLLNVVVNSAGTSQRFSGAAGAAEDQRREECRSGSRGGP